MQVMTSAKKTGADLHKKFQKVVATPASFDFFVAIHDFIEHIELNPSLSAVLVSSTKMNRELNIPTKYSYLRQIYQGLEDADNQSGDDFGHARYAVLRDLNRIRGKDFSDSNTFWKKRELFRKLSGEIYERLVPSSAAITS
jgi:hypothetical protein